ncbi:MAG: hypothetical protein AAF434_09780 [Pseudomonadota bacterium]
MVNKNEQEIRDAYAELNRHESLRSPDSLDAAILAESRRAVHSKPAPVRKSMPKWAPPLAMAATVILTATLVILVPEQAENPGAPQAVVASQESASEPVVLATANDDSNIDTSTSDSGVSQVSKRKQSVAAVAEEAAPVESFSRLATSPEFSIQRDSAADAIQLEESIATFSDSVPLLSTLDSSEQTQDTVEDPVKWKSRIEELLKEDDLEAADEEFSEFKKVYPQHPFVAQYEKRRQSRTE